MIDDKAKELYFIDNRHDGGGGMSNQMISLYNEDQNVGEVYGPYIGAEDKVSPHDQGIAQARRIQKSYNALRLLSLEQIDELAEELTERYGVRLASVKI